MHSPSPLTRIASTLVLVGSVMLRPEVARAVDASDKTTCIAAFDSGQALRAAGKLTQALPQFSVCAREVCPRSLQKACVEQATESSALLPTVVLSATDAAHNDVTDVTVSIDGAIVATTLDGKAIPIDPGIHTFRFEKEGRSPVEHRAVVKEAQKGQVIAVVLAPVAAVVQAGAPPVVVEPLSPTANGAGWSSTRWAAVGVGAVGVAGIAVGSVFGAMAFSKWSDAQSQAKSTATFRQANDTESTGRSDATISTVAFIAGGLLAAGGVVLFVVSPSKGSGASATVAPTVGGISVVGTF